MKRITVSDAANQLGISPQAVRTQIERKKLPIGFVMESKKKNTYVIYQEWLDKMKGEPNESL